MDKREYAAKFKDPRWQKVRLQVMERDQFKCQMCLSDKATLNVHHCYYEWGNDPWDYPLASLVTLCEGCHEIETEALADIKRRMWVALGRRGIMSHPLWRFVKALENAPEEMQNDDLIRLLHCLWTAMERPDLWPPLQAAENERLEKVSLSAWDEGLAD